MTDFTMAAATPPQLRRDAVGLREVMFQSITDMAPGAAIGIAIATAFSIIISLILGLHYDPETAFAMIGTAAVIILAAVYIIVNAACIGYFTRRRSEDFKPIAHIVIPVLGMIAFIPAWLAAAGLPVFSFIAKLPAPISYAGPGVAVWMVLGIVALIYLYSQHPERVGQVSHVHLDDPVDGAPTDATTS